MSKTTLTEKVDYNGRITTILQLDREGKIEYKEDILITKKSKYGQRKCYTAWLRNEKSGWEIHKSAYDAAIKVQDQRENRWLEVDEKLNKKTEHENCLILAQCQRDKDIYLVIDNTNNYHKYSEYDKDSMVEWGIIDERGNLLIDDISEFEIDDYEYLDNLNDLNILLSSKIKECV